VTILISHRGNTNGPKPELENSPAYVQAAIDDGFYVEVDVWMSDGTLFLGHDAPTYRINESFVLDKTLDLWCHAKNIEALQFLAAYKATTPTFFWHQTDDYTLTSEGHIWTYPGQQLCNKAICVMPELHDVNISELSNCMGICSDYIKRYSDILRHP